MELRRPPADSGKLELRPRLILKIGEI